MIIKDCNRMTLLNSVMDYLSFKLTRTDSQIRNSKDTNNSALEIKGSFRESNNAWFALRNIRFSCFQVYNTHYSAGINCAVQCGAMSAEK